MSGKSSSCGYCGDPIDARKHGMVSHWGRTWHARCYIDDPDRDDEAIFEQPESPF